MTYAKALATARRMAADLSNAKTLAELDVLYVSWIGYSIVADDPQVQAPEVNDILQDYLREVCHSTGVHWLDAHKA